MQRMFDNHITQDKSKRSFEAIKDIVVKTGQDLHTKYAVTGIQQSARPDIKFLEEADVEIQDATRGIHALLGACDTQATIVEMLTLYQQHVNGAEFYSSSFYKYTGEFFTRFNETLKEHEPNAWRWRWMNRNAKISFAERAYGEFKAQMQAEQITPAASPLNPPHVIEDKQHATTHLAAYRMSDDALVLLYRDLKLNMGVACATEQSMHQSCLPVLWLASAGSFIGNGFDGSTVCMLGLVALATNVADILHIKNSMPDNFLGLGRGQSVTLDRPLKAAKQSLFHEFGHCLETKLGMGQDVANAGTTLKYGFTDADGMLFIKSQFDLDLNNKHKDDVFYDHRYYVNNVRERYARYAATFAT